MNKEKIKESFFYFFKIGRSQQIMLGVFLILFSIILFASMISYFNTWKVDQSELDSFFELNSESKNIARKFGSIISHFLIYKMFGIASFIFSFLFFISGITFFAGAKSKKLIDKWFWGLYMMIWISIFTSFNFSDKLYGGSIGLEVIDVITVYIGEIGIISMLIFGLIYFLVIFFKIRPENIYNFLKKYFISLKQKSKLNVDQKLNSDDFIENIDKNKQPVDYKEENKNINIKKDLKPTIENFSSFEKDNNSEEKTSNEVIKIEINDNSQEEILDEDKIAKNLVKKFGEYDHTLELKNFKPPTVDLLKDYDNGGVITINEEELEENKEKIIETLKNYKIGIDQIKATIGPTVTLYEIVPEAGIRISKIKNLEDDIALSLSALGIRIIAPIPGKGTIGIEVPNKKPSVVSMKSVISAKNYQEAEMELPIALGKTISNETYVVDLTRMPHLLMAGATGQGKSVGLNAVLTSLIYKKHPSEVKFVLVDPKKVELTLFNKIERHYLAKLPDTNEAIITDNKEVIKTLNSLCIEMDNRYELLKNALCRNIKEYNKKFKERKLNPESGNNFLPYIVLIIDEFADLIMTAGKEVETPIARLAQLARAVGIHLIIATQRPSVNVITGIIKANFPARIAFRVTSKIDSRTILDSGGADQLIGRGDMLYTQGNNLVRIQCAFVDTPEIQKITDFIGSQKAYSNAYELPEYIGDDLSSKIDNNIEERDVLFNEAAEVIVIAQQGSASLLQRKMKLGYNRAGRIIDQLEAAGIVGPFEGSKAREVLINDIASLNAFLQEEKNQS
ncbi:MAG: cell division protein FtsK [Flavobacteriaceae bacterium]|nr:cell division protein FtsK [Flavobacteriaceae bacterium]|tara:strand:- start:560 stop:2935 length:2376 start_codon:yes stop_codon:yes gene_type:complete